MGIVGEGKAKERHFFPSLADNTGKEGEGDLMLENFFIQLRDSAASLFWTVLMAALVLLVGMLLVRLLLKLTKRGLSKSKLDVTMHTILLATLRIVCYTVLALVVMQVLGIPTTSLITTIGAAGVAVGLALKDSLSSFAAGILILFNGHLHVGDAVDIDGTAGQVKEVGLMFTTVNTYDNRHVTLPNSTVLNARITNYSTEKQRRLDMVFTIAYEDDVNTAISLIKQALARHSDVILNEPAPPFVRMTELADSAVKITLRVWLNSSDYWDTHFALLEEIKRDFENGGVHIPYNQLDVHLHGEGLHQ